MLQGRLSPTIAAATLVLAACGGTEDTAGAGRDPAGSSVADDADLTACGAAAATLRLALESHRRLTGEPANDEAELVDGGHLRAESELWDVVDGEIVAVDPACAAVVVETTEIVTSTEPVPSAAQILAGFTPQQIEALGGPDCAREIAAISAAEQRFVAETGSAPTDLEDLIASGLLDTAPSRDVVDGELVPADDSGCVRFTEP